MSPIVDIRSERFDTETSKPPSGPVEYFGEDRSVGTRPVEKHSGIGPERPIGGKVLAEIRPPIHVRPDPKI
jgi:hypothetical protein